MTKGSLLYQLDSWINRYNIAKGIEDLEKALKENNLDYSNITMIFKYSRDNYGEISLMTRPTSNIKIKFDKI